MPVIISEVLQNQNFTKSLLLVIAIYVCCKRFTISAKFWCTYVSGMPVSLGTMSRSDSAFTMSSMSMGGRSESFTITLGAQMKAMHNLRFVR